MKKRTKIIFSVLVVAAVLAATYRVVNRPPSASLESSAQMEEIIASSGCMACHTANPELPFMPVCRLPENWSRKMLVWPTALSI